MLIWCIFLVILPLCHCNIVFYTCNSGRGKGLLGLTGVGTRVVSLIIPGSNLLCYIFKFTVLLPKKITLTEELLLC